MAALIVVTILSDIVNTVSLVVGLNTSPRTERRAFRLAEMQAACLVLRAV